MRHIFILNPTAGKTQAALQLQPLIESFFEKYPMEYRIYVTERPGHATEIVKEEVATGEAVRFYACGGDGTVLEVVNGLAEAENAELACIPCGSGNDFLRMLPNRELFDDFRALVMGEARPVDAILCNGKWSLNICSMGLDADVANRMVLYKHLPFVSGPMAYNLALVQTFLRPLGQPLRIVMETPEGIVERTGNYMFALAANGQYYGGGYHGSPLSEPDDGLLNFVLISKISHLKVLSVLNLYKNGQHLDLPCCETFRGTKMQVLADKPACVTADGECFTTTAVSFELHPQAVRFVYPAANVEELLKNYKNSAISQSST